MIDITRVSPGTYDPATDTYTGAVVTTVCSGAGVMVGGDPQRYAAQGLELSTMPTILFTPAQYNLRAFTDEFALPGDRFPWNDEQFVVRDVDPVAPDGMVILARIVIARSPS